MNQPTRRMFIIGILALVVSFGNAGITDLEKSKVTFAVRNMKIRTVEGSFNGMEGKVKFDPSNITQSSFSVCIDVSSVDTGSEKLDEHLLKEDFFNVEKYPTICFKSDSILKVDDGFVDIGALAMLNTTRKIEISLKFLKLS